MLKPLRIATRRSPLALWQAEFIKRELQQIHQGLEVELVAITTRGDKILDAPLAKVGGKGLFVKELELAMLDGRADIAVHSMKDVPMEFPEGLGLSIICEREDPRDALVSPHFSSIAELSEGARVGTSSLRRQCQLRQLRPDLEIIDLRGNVNTRLAKMDAGEYDAIILASAGLLRLKMESRIQQFIPPEISLPAGGQGAVGVEARVDDEAVKALLAPLHHQPTADCVLAERAMNQQLNGGCQVPIACYAIADPNSAADADTTARGESKLWLRGLVGRPDGSLLLSGEARASREQCVELGVTVAEDLLQQGAAEILAEVYQA